MQQPPINLTDKTALGGFWLGFVWGKMMSLTAYWFF